MYVAMSSMWIVANTKRDLNSTSLGLIENITSTHIQFTLQKSVHNSTDLYPS